MRTLITCLNGRFMRATRATVPVTDRGFRFGDGAFETIRLQNSVPYQWDLHLARLSEGLAALRIPMPAVDWASIARTLIHKNRANDGALRLSISRGTGSSGYLPYKATPFWVMEYMPARALSFKPCKLWLSSLTRAPLSSLPGNHKLAQGVSSTLALLEAEANHCDEALQLTPGGLVASAASANIFWAKGKSLFTPSLATGCLNGTTRAAIMRLSPVPVHEIDAERSILDDADAAFLTNSRVGIWPIESLAPKGIILNATSPLIIQIQNALSNDRDNYYNEYSANWKNHS